jgi:hypothetical protein
MRRKYKKKMQNYEGDKNLVEKFGKTNYRTKKREKEKEC